MTPAKFTAVANTAALLFSANQFRYGARIQNFLTVPIWVGQETDPTMGDPSIYVPPANAPGDPGIYVFDGPCFEAWYYKTIASGTFTVHMW